LIAIRRGSAERLRSAISRHSRRFSGADLRFSSETDPLTTLGVADLNLQIEVGNLTFSARAFGSALA
jgi:hypothetical protein